MRILVGSRALAYHEIERTSPKDFDYWVLEGSGIPEKRKAHDYHIVPESVFGAVMVIDNKYSPYVHKDESCLVASEDSLYTIKCSHFQWDIHWEKTKADILWLKAKGCKLIPELYHVLVEHWKKEHGDKSFLSLKQDKDDFFNDHVTYVYDHDYIHELVAYPNKPMYTHVLQDGEDVLICKKKFDSLPFNAKVRLFREEIASIAAERWLINPHWKGKVTWVQAHHFALKKTIISLTKNWASDFIIHNLEEFVKPDYSYFKHLIETLEL